MAAIETSLMAGVAIGISIGAPFGPASMRVDHRRRVSRITDLVVRADSRCFLFSHQCHAEPDEYQQQAAELLPAMMAVTTIVRGYYGAL